MPPIASEEEKRQYIELLLKNARRLDYRSILRSPEVKQELNGQELPSSLPVWTIAIDADDTYIVTGLDAKGQEVVNFLYTIGGEEYEPRLTTFVAAQLLVEGAIIDLIVQHGPGLYSDVIIDEVVQDMVG